MNTQTLLLATGLGLAAQLAMVIAGHYVPFVKDHVFMFGGMAISLVAGLLYARLAHQGWSHSLLGGVIAGAACALLGIAVSVALKDTPAIILAIGTCSSALAGLTGGAVGKLLA